MCYSDPSLDAEKKIRSADTASKIFLYLHKVTELDFLSFHVFKIDFPGTFDAASNTIQHSINQHLKEETSLRNQSQIHFNNLSDQTVRS